MLKHSNAKPLNHSLVYVTWTPPVDSTWSMRHYVLLLRELEGLGWDVSLLTRTVPQNADLNELWTNVPVIKTGPQKGLLGKIRFLVKVLCSNAGIMWCMIWGWVGWALLLRKLTRGKPYVVWLDGYSHLAPWDAKNRLQRLWMELRYGLVLRGASVIYAEAPQNLEYTRKALPKATVKLTPPSLWIKNMRQIERQWHEEGFDPLREPRIFYSGRLVEHKQIHYLITAFFNLADEFPDWRLDIRGPITDPLYKKYLDELIVRYSLQTRVSFYAPVYGEALYRHFRLSSVFCLPSRLEGFPTTILEAMYFGGAIVAAQAGWIEFQLAGGCGLMYPSGDQTALTQHLRRLMASESLRNDLMSKARERVLSEFAWEKRFSEIESELRRVVTQGR